MTLPSSTARVQRPVVTVKVGPLENYGFTNPGWAKYWNAETAWKNAAPVWQNLATERVENVVYDPLVQRLVLVPNWLYEFIPPSMDIADWTVGAGDFDVCYPPSTNPKPECCRFIHAYNSEQSHVTQITGNVPFPAAPYIVLRFVHTPQTPILQDPATVRWEFSFGGVWTLVWGPLIRPYLTNGAETYTLPLEFGEQSALASLVVQDFRIRCVGSKLYIGIPGFGTPWVLRDIAPVVAGPVSFASTGGPYAFNVQAVQYAASGWIETDWLTLNDDFEDPAEAETYFDVVGEYWPKTQPAGIGDVVISEVERDPLNVRRRRFRLALNASADQYQSPLVGAWQVMYAPYDAVLEWPGALPQHQMRVWVDITPWLTTGGATERAGVDVTARSMSMDVLPFKQVAIRQAGEVGEYTLAEYVEAQVAAQLETLWDYSPGDAATRAARFARLRGRYAIWCEAGYQYDSPPFPDGNNRETMLRFQGVVTARGLNEVQATGDAALNVLSWTAYDRASVLQQRELRYPPCVLGWRVADALRLLARWGGVVSKIIREPYPMNSVTIPDPEESYGAEPSWGPTTRAGEAIAGLTGEYAFIAGYVNGAFVPVENYFIFPAPEIDLTVNPVVAPTPVATFRSLVGGTVEYWDAIKVVAYSADLSNVVNQIDVEGWRPANGYEQDHANGVPLLEQRFDLTSFEPEYEGQDRFMGQRVVRTYIEHGERDQTRLATIANRAFRGRDGGWPSIALTGPRVWRLCPHQTIRVRFVHHEAEDAMTGGDYYIQVMDVANTLRVQGTLDGTATGRLRGYYHAGDDSPSDTLADPD